MTKKISLLLIFACSFVSFLLGWFCAVFMLSGSSGLFGKGLLSDTPLSQNQELEEGSLAQDPAEITAPEDTRPFLEQIKNNMLFLFDPYQWDQASTKNTLLENQKGYIHKKPQNIELKNPAQQALNKNPSLTPLKPKKTSSTKEELLALMEAEKASGPPLAPLSPKLKAVQEDFLKKNKAHLLAIENQQKFFKSDGKYSFLVNVFSTQEEALKYFIDRKERYPLWNFLVKAYPDHIRIYLGPFPSKELAMEFKNNLSAPYSLDYLEEVSL